MEIKKVRDLTLIKLDESRSMVIACDSCGGIGMKQGDVFKVPPFYVAGFTARVVLLEVMCSGAEVVTITNAVCCEMDDTGSEMIRGIKEELKAAGISDVVLTGSTEENFKTTATGVGMTVVGIAENDKLRVNGAKEKLSEEPSLMVVSIGIPKVGGEIDFTGDKDIVSYEQIKALLSNASVYEIVPVGSKGIKYEAAVLAESNELNIVFEDDIIVDINKSGGPATCVIAAVKQEALGELQSIAPTVNIIGRLCPR